MQRVASVGTVFALLACWFWLSARTSPADLVQARVDSVFSSLVPPNEPGLAVLVQQDGKILFEKGYGVRDLRTRARIDAQTNFRLASVTKQFTAMAIMLLVHDGKLQYEDRLTDIFPDFPAYGKTITIRNLLTHTGGLPDYEELMEREERRGSTPWSPDRQIRDEEVLQLLEVQPTGLFAPGTRWEYSNSGYVVLGLVVAKASGMPYRQFMQQRIFTPLKMSHTLVYEKGVNVVGQRAFGHSKEDGKLVETDQSSTSATLGDGGIYSNVADLSKWDEGLAKHTLLSEKETLPAFTPVKLADGSEPHWPREPNATSGDDPAPVAYGFGWFLDPYKAFARMYHDGSTQGFRTTIQRFREHHLTVVVLSNRTDLNPNELSVKAAEILLRK